MSEQEEPFGGEDFDFTAPETGAPDQEAYSDPRDAYQAPDSETRDAVLRNAHAYLYDRESQKDKESPFREGRGQKAVRTIKKHWNTFIGAAGSGFGKKWGNQDPTQYDRAPLDRAFQEGMDEKRFEEVKKAELAKGPGKADIERLQQNAIFREAFAIREKTARLLDEKRRSADWVREDEIDAELNLAYLQLMTLAHTRSFEAAVTSETATKRTPVDRSIRKEAGESEAEWRQRAQSTKQEVKYTGLSPIFENGTPDLYGVRPTRADATRWHNDWTEKVMRQERESGRAAGYDKPIRTEGKLTRETLEHLNNARRQITSIADILRLVPPEVLEQRYGIRVAVERPEEAKKIVFPGKKRATVRHHTRSRSITLLLPDTTGGAYVNLSVEPRGFVQEKDGKLTTSKLPSSLERLEQEEYLALLGSVIKHQQDSQHPYPTLLYQNIDPTEILNGQALRELEYQYARVLQDYPDLEIRAEQEAERERAAEAQQIAEENIQQGPVILVDD